MSRLGEVIKELRRANGLSRDELAVKADISVPFLTKIEQNRRKPSQRSLQRIAEALDTTAQDVTSRAALWEASDAPTGQEMGRRLLRAVAAEAAAATAAPAISALAALLGSPAGLTAVALMADAASEALQRRKAKEGSVLAHGNEDKAATPVDPAVLRHTLISRINALTDEQMASLAVLSGSGEVVCRPLGGY
ncbi:helix-turn-helix domain-containing protein [Streptomyces sp. NPDC020794]|uniref:helix-turn-helix domain-containing protein n=1 Tax=unclassified Streptomyces TaxID=2593676 RepID=UPI0036E4453C